MRKLTVNIEPNNFLEHIGDVFSVVQKAELVEMVHMNFSEMTELNIVKIYFQEGKGISDLEKFPGIEIIGVLDEKKNEITCLMKKTIQREFEKILDNFKLDLIYTRPCIFSQDELVYSCIGKEDDLDKFIDAVKMLGKITNISFKKHSYTKQDLLHNLTDKQKNIFETAKKNGYYKYPREITSEKLALILGIKKSTLIEHLRRIENKIFDSIE